jgi:hypothetical protein
MANFKEGLAQIVDDYVAPQHKWYLDSAKGPHFCFRACGLALIALSVTVPLLAQLPESVFYGPKDIWISVAGLMVTALTAISTFYGWERQWQSRMLTSFDLRYATTMWNLRVAKAEQLTDGAAKNDEFAAAANDYVSAVHAATRSEATGFFAGLQMAVSKVKKADE